MKSGQNVAANRNGKKGFLIPVSWEVSDFVRVQADSLEEALNWLKENSDEIPLGTEPEYVDASYQIGSLEECQVYLDEVEDYSRKNSVKMAVDIMWDFDEGEEGSYTELPARVKIPANVPDEGIADWLSDTYGWCVESFQIETVEEEEKICFSAFKNLKEWAKWYACSWPWCPIQDQFNLDHAGLMRESEFEAMTTKADWEKWYLEDERFIMDASGRIHETAWQNGFFRKDIENFGKLD